VTFVHGAKPLTHPQHERYHPGKPKLSWWRLSSGLERTSAAGRRWRSRHQRKLDRAMLDDIEDVLRADLGPKWRRIARRRVSF
jgi:hypothetical protein